MNNFVPVQRWGPEVALRQKVHELLQSLHPLHPAKGDTIYLVIDDPKKAKRGQHMEAVANMKDPLTDTYLCGHQHVCSAL